MRTDDGYRFSLGWSGNSEERRAVGELLETLNNRKSDLVVQAVWEYIQTHPEVAQPDSKVVIKVHATPTDEQMLAKIKRMVEESMQKILDNAKFTGMQTQVSTQQEELSEADLDDMLMNLDIFNQQP